MNTRPRALRRARAWTAGLLTASTVLAGLIGIHLADARSTALATQSASSSSTTGSLSTTGSSDDNASDDNVFGTGSSNTSSNSSSSGFAAVAPLTGGNGQAPTNSSAS